MDQGPSKDICLFESENLIREASNWQPLNYVTGWKARRYMLWLNIISAVLRYLFNLKQANVHMQLLL